MRWHPDSLLRFETPNPQSLMKKTLRTFVAVEISESVRAAAAELIQLLCGTAAKVKWVEPHNLHVSLKFLGDVPQGAIVDVCRAVERGAGAMCAVYAGNPRRRRLPHAGAAANSVARGRRRGR